MVSEAGPRKRAAPYRLRDVSDVIRHRHSESVPFDAVRSVRAEMWLTAEARGIGMQVMSVFSDEKAESELHRILFIPPHMKIAFACRLGYPAVPPGRCLRVRRDLARFTHRNSFRSGR